MLQPPEPINVAHLFPRVLDELLSLLKGLDEQQWDEPTACSGWLVKDVALHLLGIEIGNLSTRRDGHSLSSSMASWDELVTFINDWNEQWVQVARRISSPLLIDLLKITGEQTCEYFRSLEQYAEGGPISWVGPEPVPVWLDIAREYTERWHHQQHIRDAVRRPGLKEPGYLGPVLSAFAWALPRAFHETDAPEGTSVTLTITGGAGGQWSILRQAGQWQFYVGAPNRPAAEIILHEEVAWRLFTRGLGPDEARPHVTLAGDQTLGNKVFNMVSIIA